jgi:hypothetical protein
MCKRPVDLSIVVGNPLIRETNTTDRILDINCSVKYYGQKQKMPYNTQDRTYLFGGGKYTQV